MNYYCMEMSKGTQSVTGTLDMRQIERTLIRNGGEIVRTTGTHKTWKLPNRDTGEIVTVGTFYIGNGKKGDFHKSGDLMRNIIETTGIPPEEFYKRKVKQKGDMK